MSTKSEAACIKQKELQDNIIGDIKKIAIKSSKWSIHNLLSKILHELGYVFPL